MRAARYVRVSTEQQTRNTSIPNQLEQTQSYIDARGWELVQTFVEPGESGASLDRPALSACRSAAKSGAYDVLLVYDLDRFNRNLRDLLNLRYEFQELGLEVWSICDNLEMTSCDESAFIQTVLRGVFSQIEREKIRRRMQSGREYAVRAGKWIGGRTPYGYTTDREGRLIVDEEEAGIVRSIFGWVCDDHQSTYQVARRLTALGIPTPQAKRGVASRRDNQGEQGLSTRWTSGSVQYLLHNETYTGVWHFGKRSKRQPVPVDVPAVIDHATFDRAQAAVTANRRRTQQPKYPYLLRGLIRCACGAAYCGQTPVHGPKVFPSRYVCLARMDYRKQKRETRCEAPNVPAHELEESIWQDCVQFIQQPHLLVTELARHHLPDARELQGAVAGVERQIVEKQTELDNYLRLYGRGTIAVERVERLVAEAETHLESLQNYRRQLLHKLHERSLWHQELDRLMEALGSLQAHIASGVTWEKKREIVELLVKQIVIETQADGRVQVHVTYRFEPPRAEETLIPADVVPLFGQIELVVTHDV